MADQAEIDERVAALGLPTPPVSGPTAAKLARELEPGDRLVYDGGSRTVWATEASQERDGVWVIVLLANYDSYDGRWYLLDESDSAWLTADAPVEIIPQH